jgi:two-component system response regulator FixJ
LPIAIARRKQELVMSDRTIFVVDDDPHVRRSLRALLESDGYKVLDYDSAIEFLEVDETRGSCLVCDVRMPKMNGLELQEALVRRGSKLPVIIVTGHGDVPLAVRAMKAGAIDFIEKPFDDERLLAAVKWALELASRERNASQEAASANALLAQLTPREMQVLEQLAAGRSNKLAAQQLNISPRTVEIYRARIMDKLQARSLSDLVRTAIAASRREAANLSGPAH